MGLNPKRAIEGGPPASKPHGVGLRPIAVHIVCPGAEERKDGDHDKD
jgi:hypothetical protein